MSEVRPFGPGQRVWWRTCLMGSAVLFFVTEISMLKQPVIDRRRKPLNNRFLFVTSRNDTHTSNRVAELQATLHETLLVVWDNADISECPFATTTPCIDESDQTISTTHHFNYFGGGLERAVMWSIAHRNQYDYIWFMEDDVAFSDIHQLVRLLEASSKDKSDLLSQGDFSSAEDEDWKFWYSEIMGYQLHENVFGKTPMVHTLLNLYRVSRDYLSALEEFYCENNKSWFFFEAMIPTLVQHKNLSSGDYSSMVDLHMRYRPCHMNLEEPGIYHPVKFDDTGNFRECYAEAIDLKHN